MINLKSELHTHGSCYISFASGYIDISPWTVIEKSENNLRDILLENVKELTGLSDNVLEITLNEAKSLSEFIAEIDSQWEQRMADYE